MDEVNKDNNEEYRILKRWIRRCFLGREIGLRWVEDILGYRGGRN